MATKNSPNEATTVCSICLEPYKGRHPKLLPCFHTVCLPCLKDLEQHHTVSTESKGDNDEVKDNRPLTFPCPTCRATITVPPGGVIQFQANFYLNDEALTCDICDVGNEATYSCTECGHNMCDQCQRCHNKLLSSHQVELLTNRCQQYSQHNIDTDTDCEVTREQQLAVLEAALMAMKEEKESLQRERQAVGDVISRRAEEVRALVSLGEERSQRALTEAVEALSKEIQKEITTTRQKHARVVTASHKLTGSLLNHEDLKFYQQRCGRDRQTRMILHQFHDCAIDLKTVEAYIGTVCVDVTLSGETSDLLTPAALCSETKAVEMPESDESAKLKPPNTNKLTDGELFTDNGSRHSTDISAHTLQNEGEVEIKNAKGVNTISKMDGATLEELNSRVHEIVVTFQHEVGRVREDLSSIQTVVQQTFESMKSVNTKLQGDVDSIQQELSTNKEKTEQFQGELSKDFTEENSRIQEKFDTFQQNLTSIQMTMQQELEAMKTVQFKLQRDVDLIRHESSTNKEDFKSFREKSNNLVAFDARLHKNSSAHGLILTKVDCNVGEAYDNITGIFTAPVAGIYFFMARAMAVEEPERFYLDIVVDGEHVAESGSYYGKPRPGVNCTVHLLQRLVKGQTVKLWAMCDTQLRSDRTSFSGMLVNPQFDIV